MEYRPDCNQPHLQPQTSQRQHQRFSWQQSPQEEAPAYEETQQRKPRQKAQQYVPQQPQVDTNVEQNRHFSYAQTPLEHEAFFYVPSPTVPAVPAIPLALQQFQQSQAHQMQPPSTPIDERPQSMIIPLTSAPRPQPQPSAYAQDEKHPVSPISPQTEPQTMPFSPISPNPPPQAFVQPVQRPTITAPRNSHERKMSMAALSPINTNVQPQRMPPVPPTPPSGRPASPLPQKTPITPMSAASTAMDTPRQNRQSYANEPYSPHGFSSTQTNNLHAVFSPDAAHGPNGLDFALHQPGQTMHPNMESSSSKEWSSSLCSCAPDPSTCLTGLICPCILYGRTSYRLSQKSAKKDPTDMLAHSSTNGHCMMMGLSCGLWWLFPMLQRTRIRHAYKIAGSVGNDFLKGCCCCCCVAVQNEREVKSREDASRRWAGPASTDVYKKVGAMEYKPQQ